MILYIPKSNITIEIEHPNSYHLTSELNIENISQINNNQVITLTGNNRVSSKLFLTKTATFKTIQDGNLAFITNINDDNLETIDKILITEKIITFINKT
ncbi:MAG: hypothetical protein HC796_10290 [Synechococcaceae cyanobacterium RL_1_2]|nr:hypothetical protein [Synechococcaceae cyanobacterium RL_1_2]